MFNERDCRVDEMNLGEQLMPVEKALM